MAVFHSARVWINGKLAGEHLRKGYTAFTLGTRKFERLHSPMESVMAVNAVESAFSPYVRCWPRSANFI